MKTQEELVDAFAQSMKDELEANKDKGDWREWGETDKMQDELDYHLTKLDTAMSTGNLPLIKEHLADCGNFLLMIGNSFDLY
jgi:hypothetical protein